jgi:chaperone required for assembly of F1-ATPase
MPEPVIKLNKSLTLAPELVEAERHDLLGYADTDTIYYRDPSNPELFSQQTDQINPIFNWIESTHAISLTPLHQLHDQQSPQIRIKAADLIAPFTDQQLQLFSRLTRSLSSFWLALAVHEKFLTPETAFEISRLEETVQNKKWGTDDEARAARDIAYKDVLQTAELLANPGRK